MLCVHRLTARSPVHAYPAAAATAPGAHPCQQATPAVSPAAKASRESCTETLPRPPPRWPLDHSTSRERAAAQHAARQETSMHDTVIRGGTIIDGTGAPSQTGDVAIDGGRIVQVGGKAG